MNRINIKIVLVTIIAIALVTAFIIFNNIEQQKRAKYVGIWDVVKVTYDDMQVKEKEIRKADLSWELVLSKNGNAYLTLNEESYLDEWDIENDSIYISDLDIRNCNENKITIKNDDMLYIFKKTASFAIDYNVDRTDDFSSVLYTQFYSYVDLLKDKYDRNDKNNPYGMTDEELRRSMGISTYNEDAQNQDAYEDYLAGEIQDQLGNDYDITDHVIKP